MSIEEDVTWIMEHCPKLNSLAVLEPSAQALAITLNMCGDGQHTFDDQELAKLSLIGLIAMHLRKLDEKKFMELSPYAYLQVANHCLDEEDDGKNFNILLNKLKNIKLHP